MAEGARLKNLIIEIKGENNELIIHTDTFVVGKIELFGRNNRLEIGEHTRIVGGNLRAHDGTKITIGKRCMFAEGVDIRTTDSHPIYNKEGEIINHARDIEIYDQVWLARNVTVLKGAVIGNNTVVGLHSIVTGNIPSHSIAAGIPARVIKSDTNWTREFPDDYEDPNIWR